MWLSIDNSDHDVHIHFISRDVFLNFKINLVLNQVGNGKILAEANPDIVNVVRICETWLHMIN